MFEQKINLDGFILSNTSSPYLVAEMSGNHNKSISRAKSLIEAAKKANANAVKIQTYTADTLTIDSERPEFKIGDGLWKGYTLHELYSSACTPWNWHEELYAHARKIGITIFSSPFDRLAVDLLEKLQTPFYKIASPEIIDLDLVDYVASKSKPIIISTGMASSIEIKEALDTCVNAGNRNIILLHCVSSYPTQLENTSLGNIYALKKKFKTLVGLSDHSLGINVPEIALACGASLIEKHFTLSRVEGGVDSQFSLEEGELTSLRIGLDRVHSSLSTVEFGPKTNETTSFKLRRSIYLIRDKKKGEVVYKEDLQSIRPSNGLKPKYLKEVIGKKAKRDLKAGVPLDIEMVEREVKVDK